ncbi:MAG: hypothetical protein ABI925_11435, partial [Verrucomicrobiota bacterium]
MIGARNISIIVAYLCLTNLPVLAVDPGRIVVPDKSASGSAAPGLQKLVGAKGLLYVPSSYRAAEPLPLLVLLHKATGTASEWFPGGGHAAGSFAAYADAGHFIILAPEAPGQSWGTGPKSW